MGGLARHATIIERLRKEADGVLVVDPGDDLSGPQVLRQQRALRGKLILDANRAMKVDAMALGEHDREAEVSLASVRGEALVTRAGIRVGLFSRDLEATPAATGKDLASAAAALRKKGAKLVIAALHGAMPKVKELLASVATGIDVAVVSHSGQATLEPGRAGGTWVVEAMMQGKQIGQLDLHILDGKLEFIGIGARATLELALADQQRALHDLEARYGTGAMRAFYETRKAEIEATMGKERMQLLAQASPGKITSSWLENKLVPLGADIPDSKDIAPLIARYKEEVAKSAGATPPAGVGMGVGTTSGMSPMNAANMAQLPSSAVGSAGIVPLPPGAQMGATVGGYLGVAACAGCHPREVAFWKTTKHARAWKALVDKNQHRDPACTMCHVTGNQLSLPDVGCESCHGAGMRHIASPTDKSLITRAPTEASCRVCHHPPQSPDFNFTAFRSAIVGSGHGEP